MPRGIRRGDRAVREVLILPCSRPGEELLQVGLPRGFRRDWLRFFGLLTIDQAHAYIDRMMLPGAKWTLLGLETLRASVGGQEPVEQRLKCHWLGTDTRSSRHHILPSFRGGYVDNNIVHLPRGFHDVWHTLFGNMTVSEAHIFISRLMVPGARWKAQEIVDLRTELQVHTRLRRIA